MVFPKSFTKQFRQRSRTFPHRIALCLLLLSSLLWPHALVAQNESRLDVTGVDVSKFPAVRVTVYGEGLEGGLASAAGAGRPDARTSAPPGRPGERPLGGAGTSS